MVVTELNSLRFPISPGKADPPLIIDANAIGRSLAEILHPRAEQVERLHSKGKPHLIELAIGDERRVQLKASHRLAGREHLKLAAGVSTVAATDASDARTVRASRGLLHHAHEAPLALVVHPARVLLGFSQVEAR